MSTELQSHLEQLRSFAAKRQDSEQDEQAMMLAALIHAITEQDEGGAGRSYAYSAGGGEWHQHLHNHFHAMASQFAAAHEHLKPHIGAIADRAMHHFNTLKTGAGTASEAFHRTVMPHAKAHLGHLGEAVTHHLGTLSSAGKARAHNYVASFGRYRDNIKKAVAAGHQVHHLYRMSQQRRATAGVRANHPNAKTINPSGHISFADADEADEGTPEEQAQGLELAQSLIENTFTPEQASNLLDDVDDEEEERSYAHALPSSVKSEARKAPGLNLGGAGKAAANYGAQFALRKGLQSKDTRTRIRAQAVAHAHGQIMTHTERAATATLTPIATVRTAGSYWLEHKRNHLKGVGIASHNNAFNASHYLNHHADAVEKLANKHGVSKLVMAHSLAYTAAALHKPPKKGVKQTAESNLAHHKELGVHAIQAHAQWRVSK